MFRATIRGLVNAEGGFSQEQSFPHFWSSPRIGGQKPSSKRHSGSAHSTPSPELTHPVPLKLESYRLSLWKPKLNKCGMGPPAFADLQQQKTTKRSGKSPHPSDAAWTAMLARNEAHFWVDFKSGERHLKVVTFWDAILKGRISSQAQANWRWACCRKEIVGRSGVWEYPIS